MKTTIFAAISLTTIKLLAFPSLPLLSWMVVAIIVDFITGVIKAVMKGEARTSRGYRRTITKFLQYGGSLAIGIILANAARYKDMPAMQQFMGFLNDGMVVFIIYIEVTSIFENIYECDKTSPISKYVIKPLLNLFTFQLKNNPLTKLENDADNTTM